MRLARLAALCGIVTCAFASLTIDGAAQARGGARSAAPGQAGRAGPPPPAPAPTASVADDLLSGPVVTKAPFSADATTTVTQVLSDGTRIEQSSSARFYRDGAGRVRIEQMILGLAALNPSGEPRTTITIDPDPNDGQVFTLDPAARTARRVPKATVEYGLYFANGAQRRVESIRVTELVDVITGDQRTARNRVRAAETPESLGAKPVEESLGTRQIEGVTAVGRRTKSVIPTGRIGNDRPIEVIDERWESPDLRLLVRSLHRDPRTGDVEYRLTNIIRNEPPPDLFTVPPDYTIQGGGTRGGLVAPDAGIGAGGARTGGGGGRRSGGPGQ
jgi:hypothetical protein